MFRQSLAAMAASLGLSLGSPESEPSLPSLPSDHQMPHGKNKGKGQLRMAKPKSSGVAKMKRDAKKRNNIRKHSKH